MVKGLGKLAAVLMVTLCTACGDAGPAAPTNLSAKSDPITITLNWSTVTSNQSSTGTGKTGPIVYNVYRGNVGTGSVATKTQIASDLSNPTYSDSSVVTGKTYYYQVTAKDSSGESAGSNEAQGSLSAIFPPTNLTGVSGGGEIDLSWNAVQGSNSYNVYRGTQASGTIADKLKIATGLSSTTYVDLNVIRGVFYYYQVTAVIGASESSGSNEISVTP
jgi:fibronectin type 3 domain-containing protein